MERKREKQRTCMKKATCVRRSEKPDNMIRKNILIMLTHYSRVYKQGMLQILLLSLRYSRILKHFVFLNEHAAGRKMLFLHV